MFPATAVAASRALVPPGMAENPAALKALKDDQLLDCFFKERMDAAFSVLVERYGPLVYGVCRRVLNDSNDAEDAFQATFLVLVRKGGTLRDPSKLASWLYGVAYRTARKVKAKAALRTKSERQASEMPTKSACQDMTYDELQAILDEEISRLPEKYALPLVLCYLEGKTNAEAAKQLGWPEGSISRRLSRARELLRSRLARRGMAMTAALVAAVFARQAIACVPRELLLATTRAATLVAEGVEVADVVSPATAKVVEDVAASLVAVHKFAIPTILLIASLLIVLTTAVWQFGSPVQAASLLHFGRTKQVHGLMTGSPELKTINVSATSVTADAGCGTSATPSCTAVATPAIATPGGEVTSASAAR
jgi:RNA polymerase sigma factor (sigma-70 family)